MSIQNIYYNLLPELPSEVWLEIFDQVGPSAHIPCVCTYFRDLYKKMATIWAERLVDSLQDCYKQQSPARDIPRGCIVTYEKGRETIKYFTCKIDSARSGLSRKEQDFYKNASFALAVRPKILNTLLPIIEEVELVALLHAHLPHHLRNAPRSEQMKNLSALTRLNFSKKKLSSLPTSINNLPALTKLYLPENHLTALPDSIGDLTALTELDLSNNQLTALPSSFSNLSSLIRLFLSDNHLSSLPDSIGNHTALTLLFLSDNNLNTLPDSIGNLSSLIRLSLSKNHLSTLPASINKLTALVGLDLSHNQLTTLPESFSNLTGLTHLNLVGNQLTSLPASIGNLTLLTSLYVRENPSLESPQTAKV